jgi:hypothetical protein
MSGLIEKSTTLKTLLLRAATALLCAASLSAQTTGSVLGAVSDPSGAAVANAKVSVKNLATGFLNAASTGPDGRFRIPQLPAANYELTVEAPGFARYVQGPLTLQLNQNAEFLVKLEVKSATETVNVTSEAPLINTTNAEVGANFDSKRIEELPLSPSRNILNAALSVAGVAQMSSGNSSFTSGGVSFSVNGMRQRSNNFVVDGSDSNNPSVGGLQQEINNPDTVAEFRIITNQFLPEYGRAAGSVVSIVTKSGTNEIHGTAFWYHNSNRLNARSNVEKLSGFTRAPWRIENQFGATGGGPIVKNKTFFFGSLMRWTDRQFAAGTAIQGAPTEAGKALLRPLAAGRPQLQALLDFLPAASIAGGTPASVTAAGQTLSIPTGTLAGAQPALLNAWQWSARGDHRFNDKHTLGGRVLVDTRTQVSGQSVPPGLTSSNPTDRTAANLFLNSSLSASVFNEFRASFQRVVSITEAADARALAIPSFEVSALGLSGFNSATSRTAIGLAVNLPQAQAVTNYQIMNNFSWFRGSHSYKAGFDFRRLNQNQDFNPTIRGRIAYSTLQSVIDDLPINASINSFLPGVGRWQAYRYYDYFFFLQDEWRIRPNLTLTYGIRYETPGNAFNFLQSVNNRVVSANNNNPDFRVDPAPPRDRNNWAPRLGFNYRFGSAPGLLGKLTGNQKLVLRGGYSRTYDLIFNNIYLNIYSAFPFTIVNNFPAGQPGAYQRIQDIAQGRVVPGPTNPAQLPRTIVDANFRAPVVEQFAFQFQRELTRNWVLTTGLVSTKGTALFQTLDGNPTLATTNNFGGAASPVVRVNPARGPIRHRANAASSIYHSWQTSIEKRLSQNFAIGAHYTWSAFIDDASEIFNPSVAGEIAVPQDSFNRRADRGRSTYDRPHRFTTNFTYELPFLRKQESAAGRIFGGWMISSLLSFQSGPPFTPLNGSDPGRRLSGIDALVGTSIRPNLNTNLDLSSMDMRQIRSAGQFTGGVFNLFSLVNAANPLGNVGRNVLRADGINNVDVAVKKVVRLPWEKHTFDLRFDFYNLTNTRDYGIPQANVNNAGFANEGLTDGGRRRIQFGLRYAF